MLFRIFADKIKSMKYFILLFAFGMTTSFTPTSADEVKGTMNAIVDGKPFVLADGQLMRGILVNKDGSMDGRTPPRTVIMATFSGPVYKNSDGKDFTENIEVEIVFENKSSYTPGYFSLSLANQSISYFMINEQSKLNVTQLSWSADKKSFRLFADFDCKMRSFGFPNDKKKDVSLKGKLSNIRVTVPSWIAAKL